MNGENITHTQEPWKIREHGSDCFITADKEGDMAYGPEIMGDDYTGYGDEDRKKADARRIVACVNACRGLDTKELEENGLVSAVGSELLRLEAINKELIEAIEIGLGIIEIDPNPGRYEKIKLIESALAKAKEKI